MVAIAYLIPIIACVLLHFEFDYDGAWTTYLWTIIFGEGTVGLFHWILLNIKSSATEFLGTMVKDINYEEEWTRLVEVQETKTDSKGNSYTVTRIRKEHYCPLKMDGVKN